MSEEQNQTIMSEEENQTIFDEPFPELFDYYNELTPFVTYSMYIAAVVVLINFAIFTKTVFNAKKHLSRKLFIPTLVLCSIYPIISLTALTTILLPKSWLICSTLMHLYFIFGAVVFQKLCFRYAGTETNFLKEIGDEQSIELQTQPFCCCCPCLPKLKPSENSLFFVKGLVWQMVFIQSGILFALNVVYYKDSSLMYERTVIFFIPFLIASIASGLWGLNVTAKMIGNLFPDYNLMRKLKCLQLVLMLCKLQYFILQTQLDYFDFGGLYPITNSVYKQIFINLLILFEMILVSILAQSAYKKPIEL